jgi:hypothetical protein
MMRVRGMFTTYGKDPDRMRPTEVVIEKHLNPDPIEKRCFQPDGSSRPWTVSELYKML